MGCRLRRGSQENLACLRFGSRNKATLAFEELVEAALEAEERLSIA